MMIFFVSFACLWAIAVRLRALNPQLSTLNSKTTPNPHPSALNLQPSLPSRYLIAVGCWAVLCIGITEVWYRTHEIKYAGVFHWSVALPETKPSFQKIEMAPRT